MWRRCNPAVAPQGCPQPRTTVSPTALQVNVYLDQLLASNSTAILARGLAGLASHFSSGSLHNKPGSVLTPALLPAARKVSHTHTSAVASPCPHPTFTQVAAEGNALPAFTRQFHSVLETLPAVSSYEVSLRGVHVHMRHHAYTRVFVCVGIFRGVAQKHHWSHRPAEVRRRVPLRADRAPPVPHGHRHESRRPTRPSQALQ